MRISDWSSDVCSSDLIRRAGFFTEHLSSSDPEVFAAIKSELKRQQTKIELIASENITSLAVLEATGSVFTNKYAEGYPEIGRASCRERVCQYVKNAVVAGSLKKKKQIT